MPPKSDDSGDSGVLKAASSVGAAVLLSRVLGLVREQVFAYFFGAGLATDVFNVAFRIPNLLRNLFAEGAMSASLIPVFTSTRIHEGEARAWQVAGRVFRVLALVGGGIALVGILGAGPLVRLYAPAFAADHFKFEMTVRLTRWMFPYFPLVALAAALSAVLNSCGRFFVPALSSSVFNVVSVSTGVAGLWMINHGHSDFQIFGHAYRMNGIEAMAIGVSLGGTAQALFQLPWLYGVGYRYPGSSVRRAHARVKSSDAALKKIATLMIPGVVGLAATQLNVLINTLLATTLKTGSVSWLNYAFRFIQFPIGLVGVTLATASLPVFAQMWAKGDVKGFQAVLDQNLRRIIAINLPASVGLAVLGYPIIEMVFQYGRFQPFDTQATAMALCMYSLGLVGYSGIKLLVPACYAIGVSRITVISSALSVALSTVLSLIFIYGLHGGFWALALATSLGAVFNFLYLLYQVTEGINREGGDFKTRGLAIFGVQVLGVSLVMGAVIFGSYHWMLGWIAGDTLGVRLLRVIPILIEGGLIVGGIYGIQHLGTIVKKNSNFETKP